MIPKITIDSPHHLQYAYCGNLTLKPHVDPSVYSRTTPSKQTHTMAT